jgi:hypothetical protein
LIVPREPIPDIDNDKKKALEEFLERAERERKREREREREE